jgi:hypothetical protein
LCVRESFIVGEHFAPALRLLAGGVADFSAGAGEELGLETPIHGRLVGIRVAEGMGGSKQKRGSLRLPIDGR